MSDLPILAGTSWTAAQLSGDAIPNELTRHNLEAQVDVTALGTLNIKLPVTGI